MPRANPRCLALRLLLVGLSCVFSQCFWLLITCRNGRHGGHGRRRQPVCVAGLHSFQQKDNDSPYQPAIEAASAHKQTIISQQVVDRTRSCFERRRADFAMISGPLSDEIAARSSDQIQTSISRRCRSSREVSTARMSFCHPSRGPSEQVPTEANEEGAAGQDRQLERARRRRPP